MPRAPTAALAALCILAITGCAAMSEAECRFADWRQLGERDARQGRAADYFADRAEACREHGLPSDQAAYRSGWRSGLDHFCTPDSGFRRGLAGDGYSDICPPGRERPFLAGYEMGLDIHRTQEDLSRLDREITALEDDLRDLEDHDGKEAGRIRDEIRRRQFDVRRLERELGRLEAVAAERGFAIGGY